MSKINNLNNFLSSIEEIVDEARNGRMFVLVDNEDRENEGDLIIPAQMATPDAINFMATYGRGLICLSLTKNRIDELELSQETLDVSSAKFWTKSTILNLEKSMLLGDQIGGHIVTGHVDGTAILKKKENIKGSVKFDFKLSKVLQKYIVKKGSISIDGVSLTINEVNNSFFNVNIISHTYKNTTLGKINVNDKVNVEVDNIARYAVKAVKYYIKEK